MAAAETARLVATYEFQNKGAAGTAAASRQLKGLETAASRAQGGVQRLGGSAGKIGGAFNTAGASIGRFVGSTAGLFGLTVGLAGAVGFLKSSVSEAETFGRVVSDLAALTGDSVESTSRMVDVLDDFGVATETQIKVIGLLSKNLGAFELSSKKAAAFQKDFGFAVVDASGKALDANTILAKSAEFFNSNATAAQKAAGLQKLYGKSWQTLIPILKLGGKGLEEAFANGLVLTDKQIANLEKLRVAERKFNDALGETKIAIGTALAPQLTKIAEGLTAFFTTNQKQIVAFVEGLVSGAQELGSAVAGLAPIAQGLAGAWNAIPADFRKLLLGGLVANKVLKMTIGFDPIDIARKAITSQFVGRGANPGNPVFTKEVGLPGVPGGPTSGLTKFLKFALPVAIGLEIAALFKGAFLDPAIEAQSAAVGAAAAKQIATGTKEELDKGLAATRTAVQELSNVAGPLSDLLYGQQITQLREQEAAYQAALAAKAGKQTMDFLKSERAQNPTIKALGASAIILSQLHRDFLVAHGLLKGGTPAQKAAAATAAAAAISGGVGSTATTKGVLGDLKAALALATDPAERKAILAAIKAVEKKVAGREFIDAQKAAANQIVASNVPLSQKIGDLKRIQQTLLDRGDVKAAALINAKLESLKGYLTAITIAVGNIPGVPAVFGGTPNDPRNKTNPDNRNIGGLTPTPESDARRRRADAFEPIINLRIEPTPVTHRDASAAKVVHTRYGPTPADAGAR